MDQDVIAQQVHDFFMGCIRAMALCAENPIQLRMVEAFESQLVLKKQKEFSPREIGALRHLEHVKDMKLAKDFQNFARHLPWRDSPRTFDGGEQLAIFNLDDMFEMGSVVAGLMYVDSHCAYPEHNHVPHEMYFLVSGLAHWRYGGNWDYREIAAGNVIYNFPWNYHGVKAGLTPSLSVYLQTAN